MSIHKDGYWDREYVYREVEKMDKERKAESDKWAAQYDRRKAEEQKRLQALRQSPGFEGETRRREFSRYFKDKYNKYLKLQPLFRDDNAKEKCLIMLILSLLVIAVVCFAIKSWLLLFLSIVPLASYFDKTDFLKNCGIPYPIKVNNSVFIGKAKLNTMSSRDSSFVEVACPVENKNNLMLHLPTNIVYCLNECGKCPFLYDMAGTYGFLYNEHLYAMMHGIKDVDAARKQMYEEFGVDD